MWKLRLKSSDEYNYYDLFPLSRVLNRRLLRNNISNTRDSVSSGYPIAEKKVENTTRSGVFLTKIRGVWIADETLSGMFYISFQSKQKLRSIRESKIFKISAN